MKNNLLKLLLVFVIFGIAFAGCGGVDKTTSTSSDITVDSDSSSTEDSDSETPQEDDGSEELEETLLSEDDDVDLGDLI